MIYFISDTHFNHDRDFIYSPRNFENVNQMNTVEISNWNKTVGPEDDIYVLGDFFLGTDTEFIKNTLANLNGAIHLIIGNHDTPAKIKIYEESPNIVEIAYATQIKYKNKIFYLSHYPTLTANYDDRPDRVTVNLFGHTHSTDKFYEGNRFMYNIACDAHNSTPISIDDIYFDIFGGN